MDIRNNKVGSERKERKRAGKDERYEGYPNAAGLREEPVIDEADAKMEPRSEEKYSESEIQA